MLKVAERPAERKPTKPKNVPLQAQKFHTVSDVRRAQLWIDEQVADAGKTVTSIVTKLTPEVAAVLMERNPNNRKLKVHKVDDYAHDIKSGAWKFNGEPIIIAQDGLLNDGQHRCAAVLQAQTAIPAIFVFGVARDTRDTLDQGVNRSAGDYLSIHGIHSTNNIAAVAKMVWQWRTLGYIADGGANSPTRSEVLATALQNPGLVKSFEFVDRPNTRLMGSPSVVAFAHFAIKSVCHEIPANFFMDALIDGNNLKSGDPILTLRNRLIGGRKGFRRADKAELLFRGWNAHRLGQTRVLFRVTGGELPLLET